MTSPTFSFEFFPPKTDGAAEALWSAAAELGALGPEYMTVTYGAGGSTREGTLKTVLKIREGVPFPVGAHLTFLNSTKEELKAYADRLWDNGVRHIIALRGDVPADLSWPLDTDEAYFQYTSDFVAGLKSWHDFEISVGCYPETHPDALSAEADIEALKKKCDAGVTRAITQFFFDNADYYAFVEKCRAAGIETPIYPGMLPIHDFRNVERFAARCRAKIPAWLHERFEGLDGQPEEAAKRATDLLVRQVLDLTDQGVEHFHFYALNRATITHDVCRALRQVVQSPAR